MSRRPIPYLQQRSRQLDSRIAALRPQLAAAQRRLALTEAQTVSGLSSDESQLAITRRQALELEQELALLSRLLYALRSEHCSEPLPLGSDD